MYTLEQARSFIAVAEELHFGRAAVRLHITQPALSRQIMKLERSIGVVFLERDSRKVTLTGAGKAFLADARRLTVFADRAPATARRIAAGHEGLLRIGFTATCGYGLLGPLLAELAAELPGLEVDLREMVSAEQLSALMDGELDLGLARPPFEPDVVGSKLLSRENLQVVVPAGHPLSMLNRAVAASDLKAEPLIMPSATKAHYFSQLLSRLLPLEQCNVRHTVDQVTTMVALVAAGRGIAFVPESAQVLGFNGGLRYLPLAGAADHPVELHAIWNRELVNPGLKRLLSVI